MLKTLTSFVQKQGLLRPGDRVGIAVSGGADSVALLRALLELRSEFGIVLSVIHFHHGIRGAEADADANFVRQLAERFGLPFHLSSGDTPFFAKKWRLSLEAAARRLRYEAFCAVLLQEGADKICTAHTRDDQAETVLLRVLRGAGTKGLAGIHPVLRLEKGAVVRPLLSTSRQQVLAYLDSAGQPWREDATNADTHHTRNRVRHELLPLLERDFNPRIRQVLCETAEAAREEEVFWAAVLERLARNSLLPAEGGITVKFTEGTEDRAVRRRLVRMAAERLGLALDFHHVEQVLDSDKGSRIELPDGWVAIRERQDCLRLSMQQTDYAAPGFDIEMPIPGEVRIPQTATVVRVTPVREGAARGMYNPASLLDRSRLASPLRLRNWRAGDRLRPLHRGAEEKLKRLFQENHIPAERRGTWPVLVSGESVVWACEFGVSAEFAAAQGTDEAVVVEVSES